MEHIIVLFILALCFFSFFYFLYHVLVKLQNKENFSDEYKLMVASIVIFVSSLTSSFVLTSGLFGVIVFGQQIPSMFPFQRVLLLV